ncbi:MAG: NADH-quinone oxidoreductase subunit I [Candidatus Omnitrophica bacterium ADurb.Bin277]|nr:MAG: NADH-quinone oxidoreductase subunit I [Candidatus Omnitrophica bacterium ADurb.Bin277]
MSGAGCGKEYGKFVKKSVPFFGWGVLCGLWVTLKNFITSYFRKPDEGGIFTVQYPEECLPDFEASRNFPFLVYDETPEKPRCVACGICERECPVKCIHVLMAKDENGKPLRRPAAFDIDYSLCMNCGNCEEVCPFNSIFMDHEHKIAAYDRKDLMRPMQKLLKSNSYFHSIRPRDAEAIDRAIKEAAEKKKAAVPAKPAPSPEAPKS